MSRRLRRPPRLRSRLAVVPRGENPRARAGTGDDRPRLRARGAPDLLALLPYQLGYRPSESVVAVFVRGGVIRMTARIDLMPPQAAGAFAADLRGLAQQHEAEEIVLFVYSADAAPARALLAGLVSALPRLVREALYVDGSRWWSMTCDDRCCPAEGTPYDVEGHRLAAEAVFAGLAVRGSRAELAAGFTGPADEDLGRLAELAERARATVGGLGHDQRLAPLSEVLGAGPVGLSDEDCAELAALVTDLLLRDLAWAMLRPENAGQHLALWQRVVSRVSPTLSAAPLALSGMAGWISGDGAILNCAADELARRHPDYSMGELLAMISARAISPRLWQTLGGEIHAELRRELDRLAG